MLFGGEQLLNISKTLRLVAVYCLGGVAVRRPIRDRKVVGSTPGRGAIKYRSTQPFIPVR